MNSLVAVTGQAGFTEADLEQMHRAALKVLFELGISVENSTALRLLVEAGVRVDGSRAYFHPEFVEEHLHILKENWAKEAIIPKDIPDHLTFGVGDMCQYYHNPHTDAIELMTTKNLVEASKIVHAMQTRGLGSYVPGVPRDVPNQLQALVEYRIGAEFLTGEPTLDTLHPPEALPYLFELAEIMGHPLRSTNIFSVSPLRLSGYEFDIAVSYRDHWQSFSVTTYPAAGVSAPIHFRAAWVLSIAEALGGAVTMHIVSGGKPITFSVGMFPFDLRTITIVGGMPECIWMYWARAQIDRFYNPNVGYSMMLGTQAKRPGLQAGLEKGMAGAFGAMTGCDDFHYIGVLSFDDIFSPEQMLADIELCDALDHLKRGIPRQDPEAWLDTIQEGLEGGYLKADSTLDHYQEAYWQPSLMDRLSWHTFQHASGKTARERSREAVLAMLDAYAYKPPAEIEKVRKIFSAAWNQLGGDPQSETLRLLCNF